MGAFKSLNIFSKNHGLDADKPSTLEFFKRDQRGLPWGEELLGECPSCSKPCFRISGTSQWRCIYCAETGEIEGAVELTEDQVGAEKELKKEQQAANQAKALKIWNERCQPIGTSDAAITYLRARGLELPPKVDEVMRWSPQCPYGPGRETKPCIVSLFRNARTNEPTAIHRTWIISASSGKSERMALGSFFGSAIKLLALAKGGKELAIGEGIENVLSAVALEMVEGAAWAATVAGNLGVMPVIRGIERLTILSDNDAHGKGQEAANKLYQRWRERGREVITIRTKVVDTDFNDILLGRQS